MRVERAGAVVTLVLDRPQARNALSVELMTEVERELAAIAADRTVKVVILGASGPAFSSGHDLKQMRAVPRPRRLRRAVPPVQPHDALDRAAAAAGDRAGAGCGHRGRLSAGGVVRPRGGRGVGPLRDPGRQHRPLLLDADGGAVAQRRAQARDGDAADRRDGRRRGGAAHRAGQSRGARRGSSRHRRASWPRPSPARAATSCASARRRSTASSSSGSRTPTPTPAGS